MSIIKNFCSFTVASLLAVGIGMTVASFISGDMDFLVFMGMRMIVGSIVLTALLTIKQPKGYKAMAFRYYYANGFIMFAYLMIITIPVAIAIKNTLPDSFTAWKNGTLEGYKKIHNRKADDDFYKRKISTELYMYLSLNEFMDN